MHAFLLKCTIWLRQPQKMTLTSDWLQGGGRGYEWSMVVLDCKLLIFAENGKLRNVVCNTEMPLKHKGIGTASDIFSFTNATTVWCPD